MVRDKKVVFVCSPLRCLTCGPTTPCGCGTFENNRKVAETLCRLAALKGYIPIAPHAYFTRFLDEFTEAERILGIDSGLQLLEHCDEVWVFNFDNIITEGMQAEVTHAKNIGKPVNFWNSIDKIA